MSDPRFDSRQSAASTTAPTADGSIPGLLRSLLTDVSTLTRQEIALVKADVGNSVTSLKTGIASMAIGAVVLLAGLIVLLMGLVYFLSQYMNDWMAGFVVGGIVTVIGAVMLMTAKSKLSADSLAPTRSMDSLSRDAELVSRNARQAQAAGAAAFTSTGRKDNDINSTRG